MEQPTKIFIGGAVCAVLITGFGALNYFRLRSNLHALEAQCVEEGKREREPGSSSTLLCDSAGLIDLVSAANPMVGVQAKIVAVSADLQPSVAKPTLLALAVLIISGIPYAWYFLLRRIRELRDAIMGQ